MDGIDAALRPHGTVLALTDGSSVWTDMPCDDVLDAWEACMHAGRPLRLGDGRADNPEHVGWVEEEAGDE